MVLNRLQSFRVLFLGGLFLLSILLPALSPVIVHAQSPDLEVQARFVDRANIEITGFKINNEDIIMPKLRGFGKEAVSSWLSNQMTETFTDTRMTDNDTTYTRDSCRDAQNSIGAVSKEGVDRGELVINSSFFFIDVEDEASSLGCEQVFTPGEKNFSVNTEGNNIWFYFNEDNSQVRRADNNGDWGNWPKSSDSRKYIADTGTVCAGDIKAHVDLKEEPGNSTPADFESCDAVGFIGNIIVKGDTNNPNPENPNTNPEEQPTCESSGGLTWILCPIINGLADLADGVFNSFIKPLLLTAPVDTTNTDTPTFRVWVSMRNIANILLVVAMIVIVFGQAIGGGLVDAYTAKKVLPRILAAAIMINLSIYMAALAIDVTNVIGGGIARLIYAPFGQQDFTLNITQGTASGLGIAGVLGVGGTIWGAIAGGGAIAFAGSMISWLALFVLLPLVLAFLGALFTLVIRQGLIQFLVISAPIACVLYCLPNTEKYFRKWWDLFLKTLLVYPIIMIIFAIADVLAVTISQSGDINGGTSEVAGDFVKIVLLALPLFLIPYAFKMAGGAITAVHGAITNSGGKLHQGIMGNANDQDSLQNRTRRNFRVNRTASGITPGMAGAALNPLALRSADARAGRKASISAQKQRGLEIQRKQLEGTAMWQAVQGDSNITSLLAHNASAAEARGKIESEFAPKAGETEVQAAKREADKTKMLAALAAAQQVGFNPSSRRAALMNPYNVKFESPQGQYGWRQATDSMASIAGGRIEGRDVEELFEDPDDPTKKTGERIKDAGRFVGGDQFQFRSMMDEYQAVAKGAAGRADQAANINGDLDYNLEKATGSQSLYTLLNGHPSGVEGLINEHLDVMSGKTKGNKEMSATFLREMATASTKNQGTAGARDKINKHQQEMDAALNKYISDEVAAMPGLPATKRQRQEVTTVDPATGNQITTTQVVEVPIVATTTATKTQNQQAEAARAVSASLDGLARSYTPMDPNNMES